MKTHWLVENQVFDEDLEPLIEEIKSQGMTVEEIRYVPFESGNYNAFSDDKCVLFYGSLNLCNQLQKQKPWVPGSWCNLKNFECTTYYAHLGEYLLNGRYIMMPLSELKRRKEELYSTIARGSTLFVRPSTGFKSFSGKPIDVDHFDSSRS